MLKSTIQWWKCTFCSSWNTRNLCWKRRWLEGVVVGEADYV